MSTIEVREVQRKQLARGELINSDPHYTELIRKRLLASGEIIPEAPPQKLSMSRTIRNWQARRKGDTTMLKDYRTKTRP